MMWRVMDFMNDNLRAFHFTKTVFLIINVNIL
jgi:hypothetical protein